MIVGQSVLGTPGSSNIEFSLTNTSILTSTEEKAYKTN
jgi:hypothetical protein